MYSFHYADINGDDICIAVHSYEKDITAPSNYVPLDSHDADLIGQRWNGSSFEEVSEQWISQSLMKKNVRYVSRLQKNAQSVAVRVWIVWRLE